MRISTCGWSKSKHGTGVEPKLSVMTSSGLKGDFFIFRLCLNLDSLTFLEKVLIVSWRLNALSGRFRSVLSGA